MGSMLDSDWFKKFLLRSDWSGPHVAYMTTFVASKRLASIVLSFDTDFSSVSLVESPPRDLHNYVAYVSRRGGGGRARGGDLSVFVGPGVYGVGHLTTSSHFLRERPWGRGWAFD